MRMNRDHSETNNGFGTGSPDDLRQLARRMVTMRRCLSEALPAELFHDPALDILLALYLADTPVAEDNVAFYTTVSASVAGRWAKALTAYGLVDVVGDRLSLSAEGVRRMEEMLTAATELQAEP